MAINETIVTGRKFRKLIDETTKQWQRFSFWTKASDVEFDDGKTLEDKIVNINGTADLLQEQVNNLNTDANGKINSLMTEINGLKEVVEELKTNPPSPPSPPNPPEQNLPLVLSGSVGLYANRIRNDEDENKGLVIEPWTNGSLAHLSSAGTVNGTIKITYSNGNDLLFEYSDLYLLSYPTTSYCPPLEPDEQYKNGVGSEFWATPLGKFGRDGVLEFITHDFPAGYLWIGGGHGVIKHINWISNNPGHDTSTGERGDILNNAVGFTVDFSQATFTQT